MLWKDSIVEGQLLPLYPVASTEMPSNEPACENSGRKATRGTATSSRGLPATNTPQG